MLKRTVFTAISLTIGLLIAASETRALEIRAYDELCAKGQTSYNAGLILGTASSVAREGRIADAEKMRALFGVGDNAPKNGKIPRGFVQFADNIIVARNLDKKNGPTAKRLHVEHALMLTLKQNGIVAPRDIMEINKGWTEYRDACAERSPQ